MKTLTRLFFALSLLLGLLHPTGAWAQENTDFVPGAHYTNCFPNAPHGRPATTGQRVTSPTTVDYSPYGGAVTPQGTLKILVVFAGFTNDVNVGAPNYADPFGTNPWPQTDATHPVPGTTFPKNPGSSFYTNPASFQSTALDNTLSNFYFQMSQHSPNPFKMQAVFFPKRINVTADDATSLPQPDGSGGFVTYNRRVLDAIHNDPDTQNFDFTQVDQRGASPGFQSDNSAFAPNHVIDYTIIIWRNPGVPYQLIVEPYLSGGGFASLAGYNTFTSSNGQNYATGGGFTQTNGMFGLDNELFEHEFAHTLYNSPHYFMANSVTGLYFDATEGPGMMSYFKTFHAAAAWERWYIGWIELQTGSNHTNSDIQGPASLTATNGEFTLRDYVTEGDAMRIKIPNTTPAQYLWLENHQHRSVFDERLRYTQNTQTPQPGPLRGSPTGILATVEDMAGSRNTIIGYAAGDIEGCNGLRVLSAQGNFDYHPTGSSRYNSYLFNNLLYDYSTVANPFGGESQISRHRLDLNQNNIINNNRTGGNSGGAKSEISYSIRANGTFEDGMFGPDAAFNTVGPNTTGRKMGISYNPAIFEHQKYDDVNVKLSPIRLNGLSVELIAKDASTGAITVKVRYDDVNIEKDTRWTGELQVVNIPEATAANGADVRVMPGQHLTVNKSGTNNRHTLWDGDFINPTSLTCTNGSLFLLESGSNVTLEDDDTHFQVDGGANVKLSPYGTTFVVKSGAVLDLRNGSNFTVNYATGIRIEHGGSLVIRNGAHLLGEGQIEVQDGGYLCIESGALLPTSPNFTLNIAPNAIIGTNPNLLVSLGTLNCNSQLQYCGQIIGGNTSLSAICPTGNEALAFDGRDDRVTIPQDINGNPSPIHNLGQTFTVEALVNSALVGDSQPIFSTRLRDSNGSYTGMMFTIYNGNNLLLQINEQNFFDESDPTMKLSSGCHHVAVTRDAGDQLHFYIDGQLANYTPAYPGDPHTSGDAFIGGDKGFFRDESFRGQIGEVRVWNTTRSGAELNQYKSAMLTVPQAGLVGYYDMRDPSAQDLTDRSYIYYTSGYTPNGYLGIATSPDGNDPTWVAAANLTCTVNGNFRLASSSPSLLDTLGRARQNIRLTGTTTANHLSSLTISPNPASGEAVMHFLLRDAGKVEVSIQDLTGYTRATALPATTLEAGAHDVKLPLHGLSPGVYAVAVSSADGRKVIRLEVR